MAVQMAVLAVERVAVQAVAPAVAPVAVQMAVQAAEPVAELAAELAVEPVAVQMAAQAVEPVVELVAAQAVELAAEPVVAQAAEPVAVQAVELAVAQALVRLRWSPVRWSARLARRSAGSARPSVIWARRWPLFPWSVWQVVW